MKSAIQDELDWEPTISSGDIDVVTKEGIVTLSGTVPHDVEKSAAEKAVSVYPNQKRQRGVELLCKIPH